MGLTNDLLGMEWTLALLALVSVLVGATCLLPLAAAINDASREVETVTEAT